MDIEDDGTVYIATNDSEMAEKAKSIVLSIVEDPVPGKIYEGKVVRTIEIGAFVELGTLITPG